MSKKKETESGMTTFRRRRCKTGDEVWVWHIDSQCSEWPIVDFVEVEQAEPPDSGSLCEECA
jgi:hypothetical protein